MDKKELIQLKQEAENHLVNELSSAIVRVHTPETVHLPQVLLDGIAYGKIPSEGNISVIKGIIISLIVGIVMGVFYPILVMSLSQDLVNPIAGKLTPYSAIVMFALGLFLSSFIWNFYLMRKPIVGVKVTFKDYFTLGTRKDHLAGLLGGIIWMVGFSFMTLAQDKGSHFLWIGPGSNHDRGFLGCIYLERIQNGTKKCE